MLACLQAVARQGSEAVAVRLGAASGRSQAQLDGFKSRALRAEAPMLLRHAGGEGALRDVAAPLVYRLRSVPWREASASTDAECMSLADPSQPRFSELLPQVISAKIPACTEYIISLADVAATSLGHVHTPPANGQQVRVTSDELTQAALIELNDVSHFNALGDALSNDLLEAIKHAHERARAFVLQAAGPHFCVGGNPYGKHADLPLSALASGLFVTALTLCMLRKLSSVIVAAVHGHLAGGGVALSLNTSSMCVPWPS